MTGFVVQGHKWVHPHNQYLLKVIANLKNEFEKNAKNWMMYETKVSPQLQPTISELQMLNSHCKEKDGSFRGLGECSVGWAS